MGSRGGWAWRVGGGRALLQIVSSKTRALEEGEEAPGEGACSAARSKAEIFLGFFSAARWLFLFGLNLGYVCMHAFHLPFLLPGCWRARESKGLVFYLLGYCPPIVICKALARPVSPRPTLLLYPSPQPVQIATYKSERGGCTRSSPRSHLATIRSAQDPPSALRHSCHHRLDFLDTLSAGFPI